jgi:hypothetical protein
MAGDDSSRLTHGDMIHNGQRSEDIQLDAALGAQRGALRQLEDTKRIMGTTGVSYVVRELNYTSYVKSEFMFFFYNK